MSRREAQLQAVWQFTDAYWRPGGDPEAMTTFLMRTVMASAVEKLRDAEPVDVDGLLFHPIEVMRALIFDNASKVAGWIEGHRQIRR